MKRVVCLIVIMLAVTLLGGCVTVQKVVRDRVDQDVSGNRGYLQGEVSKKPIAEKSKTREYIDVKVEIPTWGEFTGKEQKSSAAEIKKSEPVARYEVGEPSQPLHEQEDMDTEPYYEEKGVIEQVQKTESLPSTYTVKEGDTLGHISQKLYGKALKWTVIYEANMDKIKDPKDLKPGMVLVIPQQEEESQTKDGK